MKTHPSLGTAQGLLRGGHRVVTADGSPRRDVQASPGAQGPQDLSQHLGAECTLKGGLDPTLTVEVTGTRRVGLTSPLRLPARSTVGHGTQTLPHPHPSRPRGMGWVRGARPRVGHHPDHPVLACQPVPGVHTATGCAGRRDGHAHWVGHKGSRSQTPRPSPALNLCGDRRLPFKSPFRPGPLSSEHVIQITH